MPSQKPPRHDHTEFAQCLRHLRIRLIGKQINLSNEVQCTEAAVSFWESGRRLPESDSFFRIYGVLARSGATGPELVSIRKAWKQARARRVSKLMAIGP